MIRKSKFWLALVLLAVLPAFAQNQTGKIHGHAQDPTTAALKGGKVVLSTDGAAKEVKYSFPVDDNGDYKGDGIAPGTYFVTLFSPDNKSVDQFQNIKITADGDTLQDFDMSRQDYIAKLTPEQRKQIEEFKQKNSQINKENAQIKNLNASLVKARDDNKNKNYAEAETLMTQATQAKPDASVLWVELGTAQLGLKKYDDAIQSLKKALDTDTTSKKPNPDVQAAANNALGEALAAKGQVADAAAAYDAAAKIAPANAAMYYTNEAIIMDRNGKIDETVAAADKATAADPNRAIAYYLKGKALVNKATVDPKTNKIVLPPGCGEAYQKYLELQPDGPFAPEVKTVLAEAGTTVKSTYKAGKK
jgi:tetratricopeptide (TPR) repeat protein